MGTWRLSEKLSGRDAETRGVYRWLAGNGLPEGSELPGLSCNGSRATGERCTLAHTDSKKRRYACNEIKLPAKESDTDRTARDTLAQQDVRRRSQNNEENRYMPKSAMIGTKGAITAIYRGEVRHAEV